MSRRGPRAVTDSGSIRGVTLNPYYPNQPFKTEQCTATSYPSGCEGGWTNDDCWYGKYTCNSFTQTDASGTQGVSADLASGLPTIDGSTTNYSNITAFAQLDNNDPCTGKTECPAIVTYDLSHFKTGQDVKNFASVFSTNPQNIPGGTGDIDDYNTVLLPSFCITPTDKCPNNPDGSGQIASCSRYLSTDPDDQPCHEYYNSGAYPTQLDTSIQTYCSNNPTDPQCACANPTGNPNTRQLYEAISSAYTFAVGCWWNPCRNEGQYLIKTSVRNPTCPDTICQQITQYINNNHSQFNTGDVDTYISCNTGGGGGGGGGGTSFFDQYKWFIIGGSVIIFLILIIIVILLLFRSNNQDNSETSDEGNDESNDEGEGEDNGNNNEE